MRDFTRKVIVERARMAIEDPEDEPNALVPLSKDQAEINLIRYAIRAVDRIEKLQRDVAGMTVEEARHEPLPVHEQFKLGDLEISERLGLPWNGTGMTYCPAHEDRSKSLSWRWTRDKLLLHCFAGCTWDQIRAAL